MKHLSKLILMLFLAIFFSCGSSDNNSNTSFSDHSETADLKIENGLYLIQNEYTGFEKLESEGVVIPFNHDFLDSNLVGQPTLLEIDTSEFVKLDLAVAPEGIVQADKRINLMITLTDAASIQLADFTEKHLKGKVAIVIGGQAVTKHKIRSRIEGGKLQITRCTDNACKHLLLELNKKG